jgi:hypothetical protein
MSWIPRVKSPFKDNDDAISHLMKKVSEEAESRGTPLTENDTQVLTSTEELANDLRLTARSLVANLLLNEPPDEYEADARNFGNSLDWAWSSFPRSQWPNLLVVAYDESYETVHHHPELHGREFIIDQVKLWLSGIVVVALMIAVGITVSSVLHLK